MRRGERRLGRSVAGERGENDAVGDADRAGPSSERKRREECIRGCHRFSSMCETIGITRIGLTRKEEEGSLEARAGGDSRVVPGRMGWN